MTSYSVWLFWKLTISIMVLHDAFIKKNISWKLMKYFESEFMVTEEEKTCWNSDEQSRW